MAKFQSPLLGYNNNVRHRGRVFHVQTEDSGVNHPHIITHLFMDGGRILKSVKKSYAEHVGSEGMSETVRVLMKEQHKAMLIALRDGQFDELVDPGGKKPSGALPAASPAAPATAAAPTLAAVATASGAVAASTPATSTATTGPLPLPSSADGVAINAVAASPIAKVSGTALDPHPRTSPPVPPRAALADDDDGPLTIEDGRRPMASQHPAEDTALPPEIEALLHEEPPARRNTSPGMPSPAAAKRAATIPPAALVAKRVPDTTHVREDARRRPAEELTLDFDALERDAHLGDSPMFHTTDLPPPPKNLFAKEPGTGTYSAIEADTHDPLPPSRPSRPSRPPLSSRSRRPSARPSAVPPAPQKPSSEGRYAPSRPAATFGATPKQASPAPSIFSEDLVSDKSLDEVILSYLAEDLDPTRRK